MAGTLVVEEGARRLAEMQVADGAELCLRWNHSVTGGAVADCFANEGGMMVLARSYLHDYAAGLGEVPGHGRVRGPGRRLLDRGDRRNHRRQCAADARRPPVRRPPGHIG